MTIEGQVTTDPVPHARDVALGLGASVARSGLLAGRLAVLPIRLVAHAPVVGGPLQRAANDLARDGRRVGTWARVELEDTASRLLTAPEVERSADRLLAGPLTDAVARSLAQHRVVERVAVEVLATADLDRVVGSVLDHELTERIVDQALASPGLERLVVRVLESRLIDELTERVLRSPEMDRVVEYVATSPQVLAAVTRQTQSLAEETVSGVRRRSETVDDVAERTVRGWLRRPRPEPT